MKSFRTLMLGAAVLIGLGSSGISSAQVLSGQAEPNPVNLLDNPLFNVAQRGTANVGTITTTAKYLWDRWAAYSGTSTTTTLSNVTSSLPTGSGTPVFTNAAQIQRVAAQTGVVPVFLVQEIPTSDITPIAGQPVSLSFWALAGSNFSAANSAMTVKITTGTGADEGLATLITGFTGASTATLNTTQVLTTAWQRFSFTGTLPATATEAAVQIGWTPVGTAGTNDYIQVAGVQLQRGTVPTNLESRPFGRELAAVQRYYWQFAETVSGTTVVPGICSAQSSTVATCNIPLHVAMRAAPTVACTFGTLKRMVAGTNTALTACAAAATTNGVSDTDAVEVTATVASGDTAGFSGILLSGNSTGGGLITASADF